MCMDVNGCRLVFAWMFMGVVVLVGVGLCVGGLMDLR